MSKALFFTTALRCSVCRTAVLQRSRPGAQSGCSDASRWSARTHRPGGGV